MSNKVMGVDSATWTEEEKKAVMAKMRSFRKNGNGRLGYKDPFRLAIETNNFPDPTKQWKPGQLAKFANEHVKCVFVCKRTQYYKSSPYKNTKVYYVGFLSDSNKYSFEEFRESPVKLLLESGKGMFYRLEKYKRLFERKNIDKDTTFIMCDDGIERTDIMVGMLKFMCAFAGCHYYNVSNAKILKKMIAEFDLFGPSTDKTGRHELKSTSGKVIRKNCPKYNPVKLYRLLLYAFEELSEMNVCPWINSESKKLFWSMAKFKRRTYVTLYLGLFYCVILKFRNMEKKSNQKKKKEKKEN